MTMSYDAGRRAFLRQLAAGSVIACTGAAHEPARGALPTASEFGSMKKIDIHTHISTDAAYLREVMDELTLKMFTICNEGLKTERLAAQIEAAERITAAYPRYYDWATTFGFEGLNDDGWSDAVCEHLQQGFDRGALAVKVWKEVGMQVRDASGRLLQVDDPIFDPVYRYVAGAGKTLFVHVGDPVQRWLSFDESFERDGWYREGAGVNNRVGRFRGSVSYDSMMLARDRMVSAHPDLRVVACHLGSMPFDVDLVADRLDRFPNLAMETSSCLGDLMDQSRKKVRSFFLRYSDRLIYGADISGGLVPTPYLIDMSQIDERMSSKQILAEKRALVRRYHREFTYYATDLTLSWRGRSIRGLDLPVGVLRKVFYENAVRWVPGLDDTF